MHPLPLYPMPGASPTYVCTPYTYPHAASPSFARHVLQGEVPPRAVPSLGTRLDQVLLFLTPTCNFRAARGMKPLTASNLPLEIKKKKGAGAHPILHYWGETPLGGLQHPPYAKHSKYFAELGPQAPAAPESQRGAGSPHRVFLCG